MPAAPRTPNSPASWCTIPPRHRELLYVRCSTTSPSRIEDHSIAGAPRPARGFIGSALAAETETVAWLIEVHLVMSSVAQSRDLSDVTIENFGAVVQSVDV
jgi:[protein-PII] uridylyltransferase